MRLLIAAADGSNNVVSTTDYKVAYLQSPNRTDPTTWVLCKYRCPDTGEWVYVWLMGEIYGGQEAGLCWKDYRTHVMVVQGGFEELYNMESTYYHPDHGVAVSVHVDDPLVISPNSTASDWTHDFMDKHFETKGRSTLAPGAPIDYLSMEITLMENGDITLTNRDKAMKFLEEAGEQDCIPTTKPPLTRQMLQTAMALDTPLDQEGITLRQQHQGRFGWLVQTTHPGLAVAHSVMSSMPPIAGVLEVAHCIYQWIQAHKQDGLISRAGNDSGFTFYSDSDWAGLHNITGEVRSRTGFLATFNGMPIDWYTGLQKTIVSNWTEEVPHIATSSANAETVAGADSLQRSLHLSYIAKELQFNVPHPLIIYIDATAAIGFIENTGGGGKMKHLDIKEGWIQLLRDRDIAEFWKIEGPLNLADFFTKLNDRIIFDQQYAMIQYIPTGEEPQEA